jgi:glycine/D-amino acid oxidase-like deaminating enzyme
VSRPERVAIIGGGVSGALSAARLAERGFEVALLEKAAIGNGSSSRSMAGIRAQFGVEETVIGMLYSEWWYAHLHEMLDTPAEQRHAGVAVELVDPCEIARRWPHLQTDRLVGATWCHTDGFLFPPVIYGEGVRRAEQLGARILQRTEVLGAKHQEARLVALETSRGMVEADWFVNCTNAWAARVSQLLGGMPLPIVPVKRFLYHLDPGGAAMPSAVAQTLPMTIYGMGRRLGAHTRPDGQHHILAAPADASISNLLHAAGFSGQGLMHAPVTALLVEKLVAGEVSNARGRLPPPFASHMLDLRTFDPCRDFSRSTAESAVL